MLNFAIFYGFHLQDVSVPEAIPLADFDEAAVRAAYQDATKLVGSSDGAANATARIQQNTYFVLAKALGIQL